MQKVVIDKPYKFVPPMHGNCWPTIVQLYLARYLRKTFGVHSWECRHAERLKASLDAGHGILLAPNHCRLSDPLVIGFLARVVKTHVYAMASWHVFQQDRFTRFMVRRVGAFSVYREGMDRQAISTAIEVLTEARRPLVVFPEGSLSRHNDQLMALMDGVSFMARTAAKRRAKLTPPRKVVIHPLAIRYFYRGNLKETLQPVLNDLETRFSWRPKTHEPILERIRRLGDGYLALKEIEYFGNARSGDLFERADALIDHILAPLEEQWKIKDKAVNVIGRVKRLRSAILPEIINGEMDEEERERRWQQLAACYYAQNISLYPRGYISSDNLICERVLETVERLEEDLTDKIRMHAPQHVVLQVGEAIEVSPQRASKTDSDPVMDSLENQLTSMLQELSAEAATVEL